jgi:hypothetical protein
MKLNFIPGALLLIVTPVISLPALAQDAAPAATKPVKEKKICRRDEASIGSRLSTRTCLTAEQWRKRDERPEPRTMENVQRVGTDARHGD